MNTNKIRFAFAVNQSKQFKATHFGDAEKYLVYEFTKGEFCLIAEQENLFLGIAEKTQHGSKKKGRAIIGILQNSGVDVLVSK